MRFGLDRFHDIKTIIYNSYVKNFEVKIISIYFVHTIPSSVNPQSNMHYSTVA